MAEEIGALQLIHTKMQHPRLPGDLILRRRLLDRRHAGHPEGLKKRSHEKGGKRQR